MAKISYTDKNGDSFDKVETLEEHIKRTGISPKEVEITPEIKAKIEAIENKKDTVVNTNEKLEKAKFIIANQTSFTKEQVKKAQQYLTADL